MSAALKGRIVTPETRARMSAAQKGRQFSPAHRAHLSAALKGNGAGRTLSAETREKIAAAKRGKARPDLAGDRNPKWKGGVAPERFKGWRVSLRAAVIARDKVCRDCGQWDGRPRCMHVHHLDGNETNHAIENLLLLCVMCHRKRH